VEGLFTQGERSHRKTNLRRADSTENLKVASLLSSGELGGSVLTNKKQEKPEKGESELKKAAKGLVYGMAMHGMVTYALKTRMYLENLFMLITMGDMLGVPVLPPYYSLRLLPYAVPHVKTWKRTLLRERDITDIVF
jgi:hypothetical protein